MTLAIRAAVQSTPPNFNSPPSGRTGRPCPSQREARRVGARILHRLRVLGLDRTHRDVSRQVSLAFGERYLLNRSDISHLLATSAQSYRQSSMSIFERLVSRGYFGEPFVSPRVHSPKRPGV